MLRPFAAAYQLELRCLPLGWQCILSGSMVGSPKVTLLEGVVLMQLA